MSVLSVILRRGYERDQDRFRELVYDEESTLFFIDQYRFCLESQDKGASLQYLKMLVSTIHESSEIFNIEVFLAYGGMRVFSIQLGYCGDDAELLQPCLEVVKAIAHTQPDVLKDFFSESHCLVRLFSSLSDHNDLERVILLIEELLAVYLPQNLNILSIPPFIAILTAAKGRELAYFCRLLSYLLNDSEDKSDLLRISLKDKRHFGPMALDVNHSVVISIPGLIGRLVDLLRSKHIAILQHLPHQDLAGLPESDIWSEEAFPYTELNAQEFASHLIEVVFVLSNLLSGPRKMQVAGLLIQCEFILPSVNLRTAKLEGGNLIGSAEGALRVSC